MAGARGGSFKSTAVRRQQHKQPQMGPQIQIATRKASRQKFGQYCFNSAPQESRMKGQAIWHGLRDVRGGAERVTPKNIEGATARDTLRTWRSSDRTTAAHAHALAAVSSSLFSRVSWMKLRAPHYFSSKYQIHDQVHLSSHAWDVHGADPPFCVSAFGPNVLRSVPLVPSSRAVPPRCVPHVPLCVVDPLACLKQRQTR